ncbi:MAG: hypothetical protein HUJ31_02330, partial [Pseudomonadales bacterium]|nr:hypothetical protein [Pseudomonadales bacterium]
IGSGADTDNNGGDLPAVDVPARISLSNGSVRELRIITADTHRVHDIALSGRLSGSNLAIRHLSAVSEDGKLTAALDAKLSPPWSLNGSYVIDTGRFLDRAITANGTMSGTTDRLDIQTSIRSGEEISLDGRLLNLSGDPAADIVVRSRALDLEPFLARKLRLADAELHLTGRLRDYQFEGTGTATMPEVPTFGFAIRGSGDDRSIRFEPATVTLDGASLAIAGNPGITTPDFAGNFVIRQFPLALVNTLTPIHPDLEGQMNLDGRVSYREGRFEIDIPTIAGNLFEHSLTGGIRANGSNTGDIRIEAGLDIGANTFVLSGDRSQGEFALQVNAPDLSELHPEVSGNLALDTEVRLGPDETRAEFVRLAARSAQLRFGEYHFDNLDVDVPGSSDRIVASAQWSDLRHRDESIGGATIKYEGSLNDGDVDVLWLHPQVEATLTLSLSRSDRSIRGQLRQGSVTLADRTTWTADDNVAWSFAGTDPMSARVSPHC